jgi:hypothetical protein
MGREGLWRAGAWCSLPVGAALFAKALATPLFRDDLLQRAMVLGTYPAARGPLDLYDFIRPSERADFVASGALPWWAADDLSMRFFRPLASAMLFFEHRYIGSPLAMHLCSLAWWVAAVIATGWLFRLLLDERAATVATWIFALAPAHVLPLAMLAQREVLVATTFGALGVAFSVRPNRSSPLASTACFAIALAAGEYALCFGGYVVAWALTRPSMPSRARAVLPFVVPTTIYLVLRTVLGYGAIGTGFYRDPFHAPRQFFVHAPRSLLVLWADAWTAFETTSWPIVGLVALGAALLVYVRMLSGNVRWLAGGSLLAALPLLASTPEQRLTGPMLVGVAATLGALVASAIAKPIRIYVASAAVVVVVLHGALAARSSWIASAAYRNIGEDAQARAASLDEHLRDHEASTVVVALGSWESAFLGFAMSSRAPRRAPWRVLVTARHALVLRVDDRTADVVVPKGQGFFPLGADDVFRRADDALHTGDVREVPGMRAEILSDGTTTPARIRFSFDHALDDTSFVWLSESRAAYRAVTPPAQGFGMPLSP